MIENRKKKKFWKLSASTNLLRSMKPILVKNYNSGFFINFFWGFSTWWLEKSWKSYMFWNILFKLCMKLHMCGCVTPISIQIIYIMRATSSCFQANNHCWHVVLIPIFLIIYNNKYHNLQLYIFIFMINKT